MDIRQKIEELKNRTYTKEKVRKLREFWSNEYKNSRKYAPLNEGMKDIKVEFKVDEDGDTIFTDGYNYIILGNDEVMDLPDDEKMKLVMSTLDDFKNDEFMKSEYDYWMSVLKLAGMLDEDIDLINDESHYQDHIREELAEYFAVDLEDVNAIDDHLYEVEGSTYWVGTYDEAFNEAVEQCRDLIEDMGLESFSEDYRDYVINNFLDTDTIRGYMQDSYQGYVEDIEYESDSTFGNRLIQEMYDNGLLDDDDFEVDEDGDPDYTQLKDSVDLESKKDEFASHLAYEDDPVSWLESLYSPRDLAEFIDRQGLLDIDACAEDCVETDGIAHTLASYDGREIQIRDDLFAYRQD